MKKRTWVTSAQRSTGKSKRTAATMTRPWTWRQSLFRMKWGRKAREKAKCQAPQKRRRKRSERSRQKERRNVNLRNRPRPPSLPEHRRPRSGTVARPRAPPRAPPNAPPEAASLKPGGKAAQGQKGARATCQTLIPVQSRSVMATAVSQCRGSPFQRNSQLRC